MKFSARYPVPIPPKFVDPRAMLIVSIYSALVMCQGLF